jgi:hypothetical protein
MRIRTLYNNKKETLQMKKIYNCAHEKGEEKWISIKRK